MDLVTPSGNTNLQGDLRTIDRMGANGYETGNYTTRFGGTSAACPQVSGVAALMLSLNPNLTEAEVRTILQNTATDMGATGFDNDFGFGRLNARAALQAITQGITGSSIVCSSTTTPYATNGISGSTNVVWSSSSNIQLSGSGANVTASKAVGASDGIGWVEMRHPNATCGTRKTVWVGLPQSPVITHTSPIQPITNVYSNKIDLQKANELNH
jgi:subtilisin family serine protease